MRIGTSKSLQLETKSVYFVFTRVAIVFFFFSKKLTTLENIYSFLYHERGRVLLEMSKERRRWMTSINRWASNLYGVNIKIYKQYHNMMLHQLCKYHIVFLVSSIPVSVPRLLPLAVKVRNGEGNGQLRVTITITIYLRFRVGDIYLLQHKEIPGGGGRYLPTDLDVEDYRAQKSYRQKRKLVEGVGTDGVIRVQQPSKRKKKTT